jgi:hypothetical protein
MQYFVQPLFSHIGGLMYSQMAYQYLNIVRTKAAYLLGPENPNEHRNPRH